MKHRLTVLVVVFALASLTMAFAQTTQDTQKKDISSKATRTEKVENSTAEKPGMPPVKAETLMQRIISAGSLTTFAGLLRDAGLDKTLEGTGEFTVFAPNDAAFKKIPADTLNALRQDKVRLAEILKNHIVAGKRVRMGELVKLKGQTLKAESGADLAVTESDGKWMIGHAEMTGVHMPTTNGPLHEISTVLLPGMTGAPAVVKATTTATTTTEKVSTTAKGPTKEKVPAKETAPEGNK